LRARADFAVVNGGQVLTVAGGRRPKAGPAMRDLEILTNAYVAAFRGVIVDVGPQADFRSRVDMEPEAALIDAAGGVVAPGFVDPHTHLVFAGWREMEFGQRLSGAPYMDILKAGGGIISTVAKTRAASERDLLQAVLGRLDTAMSWGTTTMEAKSGYGLTTQSELKLLRVLADAGSAHPVEVVPTFMGAHAVPPEFKGDPDGYVDLVVEEMIPAVAGAGLARFTDVFCEEGVFTAEQSRRMLLEAKRYGMGAKAHCDELAPSGGAEIAAEVGAVSAEHLLMASDDGLEMMKGAGCVAVLLPVAPFFLGKDRYAPARKMIDMGLAVALATDFNPGTSTAQGLPLVMTLAMARMGMTAEECFSAATINAACAVGLGDTVGSLETGKWADLAVFGAEDYREIPYRFGANLAKWVIKKGRVVAGEGAAVRRG